MPDQFDPTSVGGSTADFDPSVFGGQETQAPETPETQDFDPAAFGGSPTTPAASGEVSRGEAFNVPLTKDSTITGYNWKQGYGNLARNLTVSKYNLWSLDPSSQEFKAALSQAGAERMAIEQSMANMGPDPTPKMEWEQGHWLSGLIGKSAKTIPFMLESTLSGLKTGAYTGSTYGMAAGVLGQTGPQALVPEEVVTVPSAIAMGISHGMTAQAVKYSMDVEGGSIYWDMMDRGIDPKTARNLSMSAGLGIGLVEIFSSPVLSAIPGLKNIPGNIVFKNKWVNGVLKNAVSKFAAEYGVEVGEEGVQQVIGNTVNLLADAWDGRTNGMSKSQMAEYMMKDVGTSMADAAQGLALIMTPGGFRAFGEASHAYSQSKAMEANRAEVFEAKDFKEEQDIRMAIHAQIAKLSDKKGNPNKGSEADVKFLKENLWNVEAVAQKYGLNIAKELDPGKKIAWRLIADGVNGNNQTVERFQGTEERPNDSMEFLAGDDSGKMQQPTKIDFIPITEDERIAARDKAIAWLNENELPIGGDQKAKVPFFPQKIGDAEHRGLPHAMQEEVIRRVVEVMRENPNADITDAMNQTFKRIEDTIFWEGGLPQEEGADHEVWYGRQKRSVRVSELPSLLAERKIDYTKLNIVALRHPKQEGVTGEIRKLLASKTRKHILETDPTLTVADVDPSASVDLKPGDETISRTRSQEDWANLARSVSDYEYVSADGQKLNATVKPDGALYHGIQNYIIDEHGDLILKATDNMIQHGINFSEHPVMAMFYAENDNAGTRKTKGAKVVRISPEVNKDLKLVQKNYEELFSKLNKVKIPAGQYQIFESVESRKDSATRELASNLSDKDLVSTILTSQPNAEDSRIFEDELTKRFVSGQIQTEVEADMVEPLNAVLDKLRAEGRLDKRVVAKIGTPAMAEKKPIDALKEKISQAARPEQKPLPKPSNAKVGASESQYPKGVVARKPGLTIQDVRISKLNELRRMSDESGSLSHIPVKVVLGEDATHSDGTRLYSIINQNKHFHAAGVNQSRTAIYVHQPTAEKTWQAYKDNKGPVKFDEETLHEGWLINLLPKGLTKEDFFIFIVEHERVHLATGIDGSRFDEIMTSVIALERMGLLEQADALQSRLKFPDKARFASGDPYTKISGTLDVPAKPVAGSYKFTGVKEIDRGKEVKYATHPEINAQVKEDASKVAMAKVRLGAEPELYTEEVEAVGIQDVVEDFAKRHNLETGFPTEGDADITTITSFMDTLSPLLKEKLVKEISEKSTIAQSRNADRNKQPMVRAQKSSWELTQRADAKHPKSVFDIVDADKTGKPIGANEFDPSEIAEASLTQEELAAFEMKREHIETERSFQAKKESIISGKRGIDWQHEFIAKQQAELDRVSQEDPNGREALLIQKRIKAALAEIQKLEQRLTTINIEEDAVRAYNQKQYEDFKAGVKPGALDNVDAFFTKWERYGERQNQKSLNELQDSEQLNPQEEAIQEDVTDEQAAQDDQLEELFGGMPKSPTVPPADPDLGGHWPDNTLGKHSKLLRTMISLGRMGWAKRMFGTDQYIHKIEEAARMKDLNKEFAPYRSGTVGMLMKGERSEQLLAALGGLTSDYYTREIFKVVDEKLPKKLFGRTNAAMKLERAYSELMIRAAEEIRGAGKPGKAVVTNIGGGGLHQSIEEGSAFVKDMTYIYGLLGKTVSATNTWAQSRPKLNFFNMLGQESPKLQDLLTMWANDQKALLDAQIQAGVYDAPNVYKLEQEGWMKREFEFSELQQQPGYGQRGPLGSMKEPSRKDTRTYSEYYWDQEAARLHAGKDFAQLAGKYVTESFQRMDRRQLLEYFGAMPAPNGLKQVMFVDDVVREGLATRDKAHAFLVDKGYIQLKRGAGLAEHYNGGFKIPFAHRSVYEIYSQLEADRIQPTHGFNDAWNKINYITKRFQTLWTPYFTTQTTVNAALQTAETENPIAVFADFAKDQMKPLVKGPGVGLAILRGTDKPYAGFAQADYKKDPEKVMLLMKHGLPGLSFDWHMRSLYDKALQSGHPQARPFIQNVMSFIGTKAGIDKIAFEETISKWIYKAASQIYDQELAAGWSKETAARRAATVTGTMCQIMNRWNYGQEAALMQVLLFARDNLAALLMSATGATFSLWANVPGVKHEFRTGFPGSWSNTFMHGKSSKSDMYALQSYYLNNIGRSFFNRILLVNLMQAALMQAFGSDEDKKKHMLAINNTGVNAAAFRVRLPSRWNQPGTSRPVYLDNVMLAELRYFYSMRHLGKFFMDRASWLPSAIVRLNNNQDARGFKIYNDAPATFEEHLQAWFDRGKFIAESIVPSDFKERPSTAVPFAEMAKFAGFQFYVGPPETPGISFDLTQAHRDATKRQEFYIDQMERRRKDHPDEALSQVLDGMMIDGKKVKMPVANYEAWLMREKAAQLANITSAPGMMAKEAEMGILGPVAEAEVRFGISKEQLNAEQ